MTKTNKKQKKYLFKKGIPKHKKKMKLKTVRKLIFFYLKI